MIDVHAIIEGEIQKRDWAAGAEIWPVKDIKQARSIVLPPRVYLGELKRPSVAFIVDDTSEQACADRVNHALDTLLQNLPTVQ